VVVDEAASKILTGSHAWLWCGAKSYKVGARIFAIADACATRT